MQKNYYIIGTVIVLAALGVWAYFAYSAPQNVVQNQAQNQPVFKKIIVITAKDYSFSFPEFEVNQGDRIKVVLEVKEGLHDWVIDEFNAKTNKIQAPGTAEVEFVADKTGTFEYYCSVGNHRQMGMTGNLIVK